MAEINEAASLMGKKGGLATKTKHGPEYYKKLSQVAHAARWGKKRQEDKRLKVCTHGILLNVGVCKYGCKR